MKLERIAVEIRELPSEDLLMQNYDAYFANADAGLPYFQIKATEERKYRIN